MQVKYTHTLAVGLHNAVDISVDIVNSFMK